MNLVTKVCAKQEGIKSPFLFLVIANDALEERGNEVLKFIYILLRSVDIEK